MSELNFKRKASASGEDSSVVLFLHGYGADGADLLGLAEPLAPHLPDTIFIAVDAPDRSMANPMGYQWFPIPWIDDASTSEEVAAGFTEAVSRFRSLGATVETVIDPLLSVSHQLVDLSGAEAAAVHRAWLDEGREYGEDVRERLEYGTGLGSDDYVAAHAWRVEIQRHFERLFASHDRTIWLAPAAPRLVRQMRYTLLAVVVRREGAGSPTDGCSSAVAGTDPTEC